MNTPGLSWGWIAQPAFFGVGPGSDPKDADFARQLIAANERHVGLAQSGGCDTIWMEDHMGWGEKAHLECFTTLTWLAGRHPGLRYGTLVCSQAFRNPAYLAKMAVNLHLLTDGRFILGLGAGNNAAEHQAFGYPFPRPAERLARTEEAIQIVRALWTESPASFHGQRYVVDSAYCSPLPGARIPLMIGGGGERRTLRLVAEYADWWCADVEPPEMFVRKARVLTEHCAAVGRDSAEILQTQVVWVSIEEHSADATRWPDLHIVAGTVDEVTRELQAFRDAGVEHFQMRFMDYPSSAGLERFIDRILPRLT